MSEVKKRAPFFQTKCSAVHIDTKDGAFYNGYILDVGEDFLMLEEFYLNETIVFFSEVKRLDPYVKR